MQKLQSQGIHHITLVGADRRTTIDFWQGLLGMPFVFEQPNLDNAGESHLYFDPGDGRLITVFCDDSRPVPARPMSATVGHVHHIAIAVSQATLDQAAARLAARGMAQTRKDRGFMHSVYFRDPLGLTIELAAYKFVPPEGATHTDVLIEAHRIRLAAGDPAIADVHLADAIEAIGARRATIS